MKMHNAVVRPHAGSINPYHVGFYLFQKMEKEYGIEKCFEIREVHDDISAIRMYLDEEDFRELNFFTYQKNKRNDVVITEVSDHDDWKVVKNQIIKNTGINTIPTIYIDRIENNGTVVLKHEHDGRDLDLEHCNKVIDYFKHLWGKNQVKMYTIIEDEVWEI